MWWALLLTTLSTQAAVPPAPAPEIAVYTFGPGDNAYLAFGHAAICVTETADEDQRTRCFDYGMMDVNQKGGLASDLLRNRPSARVVVRSERGLINNYLQVGMVAWRQTIPLAPRDARLLTARLTADARANEKFAYHPFDNNCSTTLRDMIDLFSDGKLRAWQPPTRLPTYREITRDKWKHRTSGLLFSDLVLGRRADKPITPWQAMYLPEYLRAAITSQFGSAPVAASVNPTANKPASSSGRFYLLLIAFAVAALLVWRPHPLSVALAYTLLLLIGTFLWAVCVYSNLDSIRFNEQLLVFFIGDWLLLAPNYEFKRRYIKARLIMLGLVLLLSLVGVLIQPLWPTTIATVCVFAALAIRFRKPREYTFAASHSRRLLASNITRPRTSRISQ